MADLGKWWEYKWNDFAFYYSRISFTLKPCITGAGTLKPMTRYLWELGLLNVDSIHACIFFLISPNRTDLIQGKSAENILLVCWIAISGCWSVHGSALCVLHCNFSILGLFRESGDAQGAVTCNNSISVYCGHIKFIQGVVGILLNIRN